MPELIMRHHTSFSAPHEIIAARRTELAMTQTELARAIGLKHPNFISMVESQKAQFPLSRVLQFAEVLEMDPTWFVEKVLSYEAPGQKPETSLKALGEWLFKPETLRHALERREAEEAGRVYAPKPMKKMSSLVRSRDDVKATG
jgi:transcriptional regulator with XRE-family HTH domain